MKRKYIKLNDNYSHLSLGNIISIVKDESKNKTSAIQSEVFCALFNLDYINESTVNNYCIGSRSIGNDYKQIYINLNTRYRKDNTIFMPIICNVLSLVNGTIYKEENITNINKNNSLKNICLKLYNISKNDYYVTKEYVELFRNLLNKEDYYSLFTEIVIYSILENKQPLYEDETNKNIIETLLQNTDISIIDLENLILLEHSEGINISHSLKKLANDNNPYANYKLAVMEYRGEFTDYPRYDKAYEYFKKASEYNHPSAYWMMGNMIIKGVIGTKKDYEKAITYFKKGMNLGNTASINSLGICYQNGIGVEKDLDKALKYFRKAADKNYAYALNNLGIYYESLNDYKKAYDYFLKSANLGESFACNRIGEYERKNNNYVKALEYYNKALESSIKEINKYAYYNIAKYYYLEGNLETNTLKDIEKAINYFEKSSNLIESLQELLLIYFNKYITTSNKEYLDKFNNYKLLIENHSKYNNKYKKLIEERLKSISEKNNIKIAIPNE